MFLGKHRFNPRAKLQAALKSAHACFYDPLYITRSVRRQQADRLLSDLKGTVLDIGCGDRPYERLLSRSTNRYIGLDYPATMAADVRPDICADALALPVKNESVDAVLSSEVLNYVADPGLFFREVQRVLRVGGTFMISSPLIRGVSDEATDYFRYTPQGMMLLTARAGLLLETVVPCGGVWAAFAQRLSSTIARRAFEKGARKWTFAWRWGAIQCLGMLLDRVWFRPHETLHHWVTGSKTAIGSEGAGSGCIQLENSAEHCRKDRNAVIHTAIWQKIWYRLRRRTPYTHQRALPARRKSEGLSERHFGSALESGARFLLRVDDYPRWDASIDSFERFDSILASHGIRYLLGVTPFLAQDPFDPSSPIGAGFDDGSASMLRRISARTDIALHGFTHRVSRRGVRNEFEDFSVVQMDQTLRRAAAVLEAVGLKPSTFIPPFNALQAAFVPSIARYFRVLCGGPESVHYLGFRECPSLMCGLVYLPSYPPAYGLAAAMVDFVSRLKCASTPTLVPLTVHWAWEKRDNFVGLERLCKHLEGRTIGVETVAKWAGL